MKLLENENKKYAAIVSSLPDRLSGIPGSTALAAGLVSYLGSYEHHFRQLMLTVEWPMAVKERGFPLMIDSIDPDKGNWHLDEKYLYSVRSSELPSEILLVISLVLQWSVVA